MTDLKNSRTKENLMRAFAGESQARNRYTFAAGMAKQKHLPALQEIFLYTADQEKSTQKFFYKFLQEMDKETIEITGGYPVDLGEEILDQLKKAAHNEKEEHEVIYQSFGDMAEQEAFCRLPNHSG